MNTSILRVPNITPGFFIFGNNGTAFGLVETLYVWQQRHTARKQLIDMDDRLLADIGIDRIDALRESAKPFWKA